MRLTRIQFETYKMRGYRYPRYVHKLLCRKYLISNWNDNGLKAVSLACTRVPRESFTFGFEHGFTQNTCLSRHRTVLIRNGMTLVRPFTCCAHLCEKSKPRTGRTESSKGTTNADGAPPADGTVKENIFTVPNFLTVSRITATPVLGYLVTHNQFEWALGLFLVAGVTDMLDGYIARNFKNQMTVCGSFLDPLADKFLVSVLTISLTVAGLIPVPLTVTIVGRDVLLVSAAFYIRYLSIPPPKTLARYFDVTYATATLHPSTLSKINTIMQLFLVASSIAAPVFGFTEHYLLKCLWYVTGGTTLLSGIDYAKYRNSYFKMLHQKMKKKI